MTLPAVNLAIQDGGLGAVQAQSSDNVAVVGTSSAGSASVVSQLYTRKASLIADYGYGKGVEAAAFYLDAGIPVYFVKTPNTTPGSSGSVTHVGTGASVMTLSVATSFDDYDVIIKIIATGTVGSGTISLAYSLDGGINYSAPQAMASTTFAIPNTGLTASFTSAGVVANDTYAFAATAPIWASGDLTTAIAALKNATQKSFRMMHVVGPSSGSLAGTVDTAVQAFITSFRYVGARAIVDSVGFGVGSESTWMTTIEADYLTFSSVDGRVSVGAGPVRISSMSIAGVAGGWKLLRSVSWLATRSWMLGTLHTDISELKPLTGIQDITGFTVVYHDEFVLQGLDAAKFVTMRTFAGRSGYFITNPNTFAPNGSDYGLMQYGFVGDVACATYYNFFLEALNKPVRVNNVGHILEKDAQALEAGANSAIRDALVAPGHVSQSTMTQKFVGSIPGPTQVARDDNILSTKTLTVNGFVIPLGYTKTINVTFGFKNPAIAAAA